MSEAAASGPSGGRLGGVALRGPLRLLSDDRLAQRAAGGDRGAFDEIFRRYHQDLYRFCLATTSNAQDAQEALQNAMVKVMRALPGEQREIKLKPWLYRIARNEAVETLRKRRDSVELSPEHLAGEAGLAETASTRERLRGLLFDLRELPERQRSALVMRELAGLDFAEIGASFGTTAAVARQTLYEARLSLRQMEQGREMSCDGIRQTISDADGRVARRRDLRAHLRDCSDCRAFRDEIARRRADLAAITPLPLALSMAALAQAASGGAGGAAAGGAGATLGGSAAAGGLGGTAGVGLGGAAGVGLTGSAVVKSAAAVVVAAAVGAGAADRGGVLDLPLPGGGGSAVNPHSGPSAPGRSAPAGIQGQVGAPPEPAAPDRGKSAPGAPRGNQAVDGHASPRATAAQPAAGGPEHAGHTPPRSGHGHAGGRKAGQGKPADLPTAPPPPAAPGTGGGSTKNETDQAPPQIPADANPGAGGQPADKGATRPSPAQPPQADGVSPVAPPAAGTTTSPQTPAAGKGKPAAKDTGQTEEPAIPGQP
ncbi:MAG TPA: sigma-70 family RNA polymerase sigma factor [Solirubrobacterales bacterium]|nr:sigma-70 family RNA polymerase sigma factor [Solirubrobacterales bacterium]